MKPADQLPPHDDQAEAGALACVLSAENGDAGPMVDKLTLDCFYDQRHREIFCALSKLHRERRPLDLVCLSQWLRDKRREQDAGGLEYLSALPDKTPSPANFPAFLESIEGYRIRRAAIHDAAEIQRLATDTSIPPAALADGARRLLEAMDVETALEIDDAYPWIDASQGASDADILIGPGRWITRGAGVFLVGFTGTGKSTWSATQAFSWALGRESLGMRPTAPLRSLVFQAEDDAGDLAAMAGSILGELAPTEAEREQIRRNVLIITETASTGIEFLKRRVAPALRKHAPDLLWINPISTYFGSDLNDQREVATFFRNTLNPLLLQYRCACIPVHHCPKPSKERSGWSGGQLAYSGAGSADMANWAREVITLKETSPGLFEMSLAKRWRKIGWTDSENRPTATRLIAHDRNGGQVWRDATPAVLEEMGATQYSDAALLTLVPALGIDRAELIRRTADAFAVTERTAVKFVNDARRERRRNVNGRQERCAILKETERPRREVYPDKPAGRPVVWLTKLEGS
jgi:DnaB-like helicase N terminal domain/AAA domain